MANMHKEISTLTQSLTTLTHKMVDKSSRRGGLRGNESNGGYKTEENEKENTRPRNTRGKNRRPRNQLQQQSVADNCSKRQLEVHS